MRSSVARLSILATAVLAVGSILRPVWGVRSALGSTIQVQYKTLDYPGQSDTELNGIDGTNIVGDYDSPTGGFLFNGSTFTQIVDPLGKGGTFPYAISGEIVVGSYELTVSTSSVFVHGFVYNGSTYTTIDDPLMGKGGFLGGTNLFGISGNRIVGDFTDSIGETHGFLHDGSTFTTIDEPNAGFLPNYQQWGTFATGISGSNIVGGYWDTNGLDHGYLYNTSAGTFVTLDDPLALGSWGTIAEGIDGNDIIGVYYTATKPYAHGFLYDGATWATIDAPNVASETLLTGISGNTIVGWYNDSSGDIHGLIATIVPEPSTLVLLGSCAIFLAGYVVLHCLGSGIRTAMEREDRE